MDQKLPAKTGPIPTLNEWQILKEQATMAFRSGLLPQGIKSPEAAAIIALKGKELGLPVMFSLSEISVINGKPVLSANLILAQLYKVGCHVKFDEADDHCTVIANRPGGEPVTTTFSLKDAEVAGLLSKPVWRQYPRAMLRSRAIAEAARKVAPDAIAGCYTPEEMEPVRDITAVAIENIRDIKKAYSEERIVKIPITKEGKIEGLGPATPHEKQDEFNKLTSAIPKTNEPMQVPHDMITEPQRRRLWAIAKLKGWDEASLKDYLIETYEINSTKKIPYLHYDLIVKHVQDNPKEAESDE